MKSRTPILISLSIAYVALACLLYDLFTALLGDSSLLWGDMFSQIAIKLQHMSVYLYLLLAVLYVLMLLHIVHLARVNNYERERENKSTVMSNSTVISITKETELAPPPVETKETLLDEPMPKPTPELCLNYWKSDGQEGPVLRMSFEELRRRGGSLTMGQAERSDLSFGDASLALRHAELRLTPDGGLSIIHLPSGVPGSLRVNDRLVDVGQSVSIEGMANIYLGATHIVIRTR